MLEEMTGEEFIEWSAYFFLKRLEQDTGVPLETFEPSDLPEVT